MRHDSLVHVVVLLIVDASQSHNCPEQHVVLASGFQLFQKQRDLELTHVQLQCRGAEIEVWTQGAYTHRNARTRTKQGLISPHNPTTQNPKNPDNLDKIGNVYI